MWKINKGSLSGTTAGAYVNALDWKVEELREKTILLKNTHSTASLKYKLLAYAVSDGAAWEEIGETTLEAGSTAKLQLMKQWARLVLQVADGSGPATYQTDFIGQGA